MNIYTKLFSIKGKVNRVNGVSIRQWACVIIFVSHSIALFAQNVGIGGTPHSSAILDISSTEKGILIPRMTTAQRLLVAVPATGLLVFDTNTNSFWFHDTQSWTPLNHWIQHDQNQNNIFNSNGGNVGIGISDPTVPLDVSGAIQSIQPGNSPIGSYISFTSSTNDPAVVISRGNGAGGEVRRFDLKVDDDESLKIYDHTAGQLRMMITTTGNIGIGTTGPPGSAALAINSTTKGFLPPRMTKTQRNAITPLTEGLIIMCTNCGSGELQVYNGVSWTNITGGFPDGFGVGDAYGGGIVAYIYQPGDPGYVEGETHGLIAAPTDLDPAIWGCLGGNLPGCEGTALGTGLQNTTEILAWCGATDIAARNCYDLELNGFDDWFLPSKDELYKLYLSQEEIGGFQPFNYWSSTEDVEFPNFNACITNFSNGLQWVNQKGSLLHVRAIRYF